MAKYTYSWFESKWVDKRYEYILKRKKERKKERKKRSMLKSIFKINKWRKKERKKEREVCWKVFLK